MLNRFKLERGIPAHATRMSMPRLLNEGMKHMVMQAVAKTQADFIEHEVERYREHLKKHLSESIHLHTIQIHDSFDMGEIMPRANIKVEFKGADNEN